jgi:uncharacterized protein GlcG (DUF336 family)
MKKLLLITAGLLACSTLVNAQLLTKRTVSLALAKKIAAAAESEAAKNNLTSVIVVLDDGGNLIYLEKMDNTQIGSIEVATEKARTAVYFKRSSKSYEDRVAGGDNKLLKIPNIMPVEGGLPLIVDGVLVGSVGVSGGTSQQDGVVAQAAVNAFNASLEQSK